MYKRQAVENVKTVQTLAIGQTPSVKLQAQIEKKGIIQIVAQTPGVVDTIHTKEGQTPVSYTHLTLPTSDLV